MSAVEQHVEAHRLKHELGYGRRRVAAELGITQYAAQRLLDRPLPARPEEAGDDGGPVDDRDAAAAAAVAVRVDEAAGSGRPVDHPAAGSSGGGRQVVGPWLRIHLVRWPRLWRALAYMTRAGLQAPAVVDLAVRALAQAYHQAVISGDLQPGEAYEVRAYVRPCRHTP